MKKLNLKDREYFACGRESSREEIGR